MEGDDIPCCGIDFWIFLILCLVLVSFAGIASGLALGLLSFSQVDLEVLVKSGRFQDQINAAKILPLVKNEHLLLCTLLIGKSLAIEALPIFLDSILPPWAAILISVTLVMSFAEIIPQAVCSRYGLSIGAKMSGLVRLLLVVFFPISYPIGKLLDWLLGKGHPVLLGRAELKTLVDLHANEAGKGGELSHHETMIIGGALDLTQKTVKDAMTPISETFSLDINSKLDMRTMALIMSKGHSRIPIYSGNRTNIIGIILVKHLIFCHPEDETPIKHLTLRRIPRVFDNWPLYDILKQFQKGHSHMAVVVKRKKHGEQAANIDASGQHKKHGEQAANIDASGQHSVVNGNTKSILQPTSEERKGANPPFALKEYLDTSPSCSSDTAFDTPISKNAMGQDMGFYAQYKQWENGDENILYESLESFQSDMKEEAIGIITMEDVMEELLQEDILDETDQYVYVQNKIKINLKASRRSSSTSPEKSLSHLHRRSSEFSPLSSYTPILRSPMTAYTRPPLIRPTLYASPGNSTPKSPAQSVGPVFSSPSSHRVARKSYEKL